MQAISVLRNNAGVSVTTRVSYGYFRGQAGFRLKRSCIDSDTLNELVQGRLREDKLKTTYADVQKAYDTVWRDGLWLKLWDMGVKGRIWRITLSTAEKIMVASVT